MKTDFIFTKNSWMFCITLFFWGIGFGVGRELGFWSFNIQAGPFYLEYTGD